MKKKTVLKRSLLQQVTKTFHFGQKITISLLFRGTYRRLRIVTYTGFISNIIRNKRLICVCLNHVVFGYNFFIKFIVTSNNLIRLAYIS